MINGNSSIIFPEHAVDEMCFRRELGFERDPAIRIAFARKRLHSDHQNTQTKKRLDIP